MAAVDVVEGMLRGDENGTDDGGGDGREVEDEGGDDDDGELEDREVVAVDYD